MISSLLEALLVSLTIGSVLATGDIAIRILACRTPMLLPEKVGLAWVLGSGLLPLAVWIVGPLLGPALVRIVVPGAVLGCWAILRKRTPETKMQTRFSVFDGVLSALLVAQAVLVAVWASRLMLGWDALLIWETKARLIHAGSGVMPIAYFTDATRLWSHPHYPLGFSALEAWLYLCLGHVDESWVRILGPSYWLSAVGIIVGATPRLGGSQTAGLVGAAALFFVPYVFSGTWSALSGYADFPLGVAWLAATAWLLQCHHTGGARLCGMLLATVAWTKLEGRYLWLIITLAGSVIALCHAWRTRDWRTAFKTALWIALPGAAALAAWSLFLAYLGVNTQEHHFSVTVSNVVEHGWRIPYVAEGLWTELCNWESWSFLWPGSALAIIALACRREWRIAAVFAAVLGVPLAFKLLIYTLSTWPDFAYHMALSLERLVLQLVPAAMLAIALALPRLPPKAAR